MIILNTESPCIQQATRQIQLYNEKVERSDGHGCSPPHIWVWGGLIQGFLGCNGEIGTSTETNLRAHLESWQLLKMTEKIDLIRVCSVEKTDHGPSRASSSSCRAAPR